ncbi:MAG: TetR/AcrR family transcriptional regulator [Acidimicrobiales bacterium]
MPKGRRPSSDTRSRLADEALTLFLQQGFAATSVREIAAAADVTIPALYYHFESKDGLLGSLVEQLIADGETVITDLAMREEDDPIHALTAYYDVVTQHLSVFRLVMTDPSVRSHEAAGHRLAKQGDRFLSLLIGETPDRDDLIRANAALGAIRRPLRIDDIDTAKDRRQILASANAAFHAKTDDSSDPRRHEKPD